MMNKVQFDLEEVQVRKSRCILRLKNGKHVACEIIIRVSSTNGHSTAYVRLQGGGDAAYSSDEIERVEEIIK